MPLKKSMGNGLLREEENTRGGADNNLYEIVVYLLDMLNVRIQQK